jgi:zinc transport system substrate-binding protein
MRRSPALVRAGVVVATALLGAATLAGCGDEVGGSGTPDDPLHVVASFYPLQWMAEQVGGDRVKVSSLTKPGAEPHDLELTPRAVGAIQDADAVVFLSEFQPGVDQAVGEAQGEVFDARDATELVPSGHATEHEDDHAEEAHEADEGHDHRHGYEVGTTDPHFWLDPTKLAEVSTAFAEALGQADPAHAQAYQANAEVLATRLDRLDADIEAGLAECRQRYLVTSHEAFGYLARRYGLEQVGITGLTPEADPSPKDLAAVADFVEQHGVATVYFETLTSPAVAEALAAEAGAKTAVLDPIEGLTDDSKGSDYIEVMRSDLETLRAGQDCA